jgi:putative transposase
VKLFGLIDAEKADYPISLLCRVLGVSRSGYYGWKEPAFKEEPGGR